MNIKIDITGIPETVGKLDQLKNVIENVEPEMQDVGKWMLSLLSEEVFATQGGIIGAPWAGLSPSYARKKQQEYPGRGILVRTGVLQGNWRLMTSRQYALLKNGTPYAPYHQFGTSKMPQRMIAQVDGSVAQEVKRRFEDSLMTRIRKAL